MEYVAWRRRQGNVGTRRPFNLACMLFMATAAGASAHQGPPFPILMDVRTTAYIVSVWADPDIGDAQFFIMLATPDAKPIGDTPKVSMWVEPASGRLERKSYAAARSTLKGQVQYVATPHFDQRDQWKVGFVIERATGEVDELATHVESTPPGLGKWDLALYSFPFLLVGGLWTVGLLRRKHKGLRHPKSAVAQDHSS